MYSEVINWFTSAVKSRQWFESWNAIAFLCTHPSCPSPSRPAARPDSEAGASVRCRCCRTLYRRHLHSQRRSTIHQKVSARLIWKSWGRKMKSLIGAAKVNTQNTAHHQQSHMNVNPNLPPNSTPSRKQNRLMETETLLSQQRPEKGRWKRLIYIRWKLPLFRVFGLLDQAENFEMFTGNFKIDIWRTHQIHFRNKNNVKTLFVFQILVCFLKIWTFRLVQDGLKFNRFWECLNYKVSRKRNLQKQSDSPKKILQTTTVTTKLSKLVWDGSWTTLQKASKSAKNYQIEIFSKSNY